MKTQNVPTSDDLQDILEAQSENEDFEQTNEDLQDEDQDELDEDYDHEEYEDEDDEPEPEKELKELVKFSVNSDKFLEKLNLIMGIIPNNPVLPILENFLLTESEITASDLQTAINVPLPTTWGIGDDTKFAIAVPARMFRDWLKRLPKQVITITVDLNSNVIEVRSDNGRYTFTCEDGGDFPRPATQKDCKRLVFNQNEFLEATKGMLPFISSDEMKPAMNGISMQFANNICTFVATDSHRLKTYGIDYKYEGEPFSVLPNGNALQQLVRIANTKDKKAQLTFSFNDTNFFIYCDGVEIISRLIDEVFPDYHCVIPQRGKLIKEKVLLSVPRVDRFATKRQTVLQSFLKEVVIDRSQLIQTIKRSQIFANRTSQQLRFSIDFDSYNIDIIAEDIDFSNESKEFLPSKNYSLLQTKDKFEIGFNAKFLLGCLESFNCDEVTLFLSEPNRACLIEGDRELETVLIMPVMLNNYY